MLGEDFLDRLARRCLDLAVRIDKWKVERACKTASQDGLPSPHQPDQDEGIFAQGLADIRQLPVPVLAMFRNTLSHCRGEPKEAHADRA